MVCLFVFLADMFSMVDKTEPVCLSGDTKSFRQHVPHSSTVRSATPASLGTCAPGEHDLRVLLLQVHGTMSLGGSAHSLWTLLIDSGTQGVNLRSVALRAFSDSICQWSCRK